MFRTAFRAIGPVLAFLIVVPLLIPAASAELGAGSRLYVETQTQMLMNTGGGYITWELSGPVTADFRRALDTSGDGNLSKLEADSYSSELDNLLENYVYYGSARVVRTALLTKDINADTDGLMGAVPSARTIKIRFTFNANLRPEGANINLGDKTIPTAIFRALPGEENRTFVGDLEWKHTEIVVGLASFSGASMDRGGLTRFRAPGLEVLWYHVELGGNTTSDDDVRFDTFNMLQCPLELFVALCIFGLLTIWFPRHYMRASKMRKVRWLHYLALLLALVLLAVFFAGLDGAVVWVLSVLFTVMSAVLSIKVYEKGWMGMAKPLLPPMRPRAHEEEELRREGGAAEGATEKAEGPPPDFPGPEAADSAGGQEPASRASSLCNRPSAAIGAGRPAPPEGSGRAAGDGRGRLIASSAGSPVPPGKLAAAAPGEVVRTLRCPKCKATFEVSDSGRRPLAIRCSSCGTEGVLK